MILLRLSSLVLLVSALRWTVQGETAIAAVLVALATITLAAGFNDDGTCPECGEWGCEHSLERARRRLAAMPYSILNQAYRDMIKDSPNRNEVERFWIDSGLAERLTEHDAAGSADPAEPPSAARKVAEERCSSDKTY